MGVMVELRNPVSVTSHIQVLRKYREPKNRRRIRNVSLKYLNEWRSLAQNLLTFPVAVGLYPITLVIGTTVIIVKRLEQKRKELT